MARTPFKSVDEYIASQPEATRTILAQVRSAILAAVPAAVEAISYEMPVYKLPHGPMLFFAGWKRHYSIYPASERLVAAFQDELAPYQIDKGTIRFPLSQPVPVRLIGRIAKFRAREVAGREKREKVKPATPEKS